MNDNICRISETPIFDQLVQELAERGKRYDNLCAKKSNGVRIKKETQDRETVSLPVVTERAPIEVHALPDMVHVRKEDNDALVTSWHDPEPEQGEESPASADAKPQLC